MPWTAKIIESLRAARRHAGWLALALAGLVALGLAAPRLLGGPKLTVLQVVQRDFVQTVVASGRVETPHRTDVGVQLTGSVVAVPVAEGQAVAAGTLLIELESTELRAFLAQTELAVRQAQARVRQVREVEAPGAEEALGQAQANYEVAERTLRRNRDLFARQFIGQAALDDSDRALRVAQAQLRTVQQQLASARPGGSSAAAADAALAQARAVTLGAQARLRYARVLAPVAGTLIARNVEPGDVVQPGKVLMVLSPKAAAQLVVLIDEKNLKLLRVGQSALASADAYPDQRFAAQLVYINPGIDAQRGSVEVKLAVPQAPDYLRQDMTVSVDIEVARRPAAVLVPTEALHEPDSAASWVLKVEGGRARRQAVRLGVSVGDKLRITSALGNANVLTIAGIFDLGNKGANLRNTYVALRTAQSLLGLPGGVTVLDVTVRDVYAAELVARRISARTGVEADSWIKTNEQFFAAVSAQTSANTTIRFFVALSVALGIASVLVVSVVQRSHEIGILRAMGVSRGQILRVFLLQGGLLGFGGAVAGCALGALALVVWQQVARNADGTPLFPLVFSPGLFALALAVAALTGLLAAFAPALRAARLDPAVAIRG